MRPPIASIQNAGVKRVVRLRRRRARDRERAFLIEGYRELLRAVEAGCRWRRSTTARNSISGATSRRCSSAPGRPAARC